MENNFSELIEYLDKKFKKAEDDLNIFKEATLTSLDNLTAKVDKLNTENTIRNLYEDREKKFFGIITKAVEVGKATPEQIAEIGKLNIL